MQNQQLHEDIEVLVVMGIVIGVGSYKKKEVFGIDFLFIILVMCHTTSGF